MAAANRGAFHGRSPAVGLNIELPREQFGNAYQDISLLVPPLLRAQGDVRAVRVARTS